MTDSSKTNTRAVRRKPYKIYWFKFYPTDFFAVMRMPDADAGKRFKQLLECLAENKAPKDSIEERMIEEAKAYSEWKRQVAYSRWKREPEEGSPREQPRQRTPRTPKIPPSPAMEQNPEKFR